MIAKRSLVTLRMISFSLTNVCSKPGPLSRWDISSQVVAIGQEKEAKDKRRNLTQSAGN
jgi:hypothetical protein